MQLDVHTFNPCYFWETRKIDTVNTPVWYMCIIRLVALGLSQTCENIYASRHIK